MALRCLKLLYQWPWIALVKKEQDPSGIATFQDQPVVGGKGSSLAPTPLSRLPHLNSTAQRSREFSHPEVKRSQIKLERASRGQHPLQKLLLPFSLQARMKELDGPLKGTDEKAESTCTSVSFSSPSCWAAQNMLGQVSMIPSSFHKSDSLHCPFPVNETLTTCKWPDGDLSKDLYQLMMTEELGSGVKIIPQKN
ncbi:hypothetical protein E2320_020636 [Naja naja]|nr:hypothetical protein E2320_020636 [Naja naja]